MSNELNNAEPDKRLDAVHKSLRNTGHRLTQQREKILSIFRNQTQGVHLSVEKVYDLLKEQDSGVSLATTYRTLKLLSQLGLLRELDFAAGQRQYELKSMAAPHQHLICVHCSEALEFEDHFLEEAGKKIGLRYGFDVIDSQFKVFGVCTVCQKYKATKSRE